MLKNEKRRGCGPMNGSWSEKPLFFRLLFFLPEGSLLFLNLSAQQILRRPPLLLRELREGKQHHRQFLFCEFSVGAVAICEDFGFARFFHQFFGAEQRG